jgi:spermidine synthase
MKKWVILDRDDVPDHDGTIFLMERGSELAIVVDDRQLMTNKMHGSEKALADFACDRLDDTDNARVLVGGLGMGFTLASVLKRLGPEGQATVAELIPAVVRWNREYLGGAAKYPLLDPRTAVYLGDVGDLVEKPPQPWSAILLDVDNGPGALTRPNNGWLYTKHGIQAARDALIPGGILGIWSVYDDPAFTRRLRSARFDVEVVFHNEEGRPTPDDTGIHVLWMCRRP